MKNPKHIDSLLLTIMALGAGCGIVYEYLIAHYAGRILGSIDTAVYGIIGLMIVSMGLGAFCARGIKNPYTGFAWLEAVIALIGGTAVLIMAGIFSLAYTLPLELQRVFHLHENAVYGGGFVFFLKQVASFFPYITAFLLGVMIGMEIPFIARIRQHVYEEKLLHNTGTVYGADYIGGGVGALIWIYVLLKQPIIISAAVTALLNLVLGSIFLLQFYRKIAGYPFLVIFKVLVAGILVLVLINGKSWMNAMNSTLYTDQVIHTQQTRYQSIVLTEYPTADKSSVISLYLNGHLQFNSADEVIYHSFLTTPALLASARQDNILIIGGGDGLAAKVALKYEPQAITLIDLDPDITRLFQGKQPDVPDWLNRRLTQLNDNALNDPRVTVVNGDAFTTIEEMAATGQTFDAIIVDLPDPTHPDLNKLYSDFFYSKLARLLNADGAMSIQSTSPYHSRKAFISIGKTLALAGLNVDQYHANVPSFGEWGWSIATKTGQSPKSRLANTQIEIKDGYLSPAKIQAAFVFSPAFYRDEKSIEPNRLNSPTTYNYHREDWVDNAGIYIAK